MTPTGNKIATTCKTILILIWVQYTRGQKQKKKYIGFWHFFKDEWKNISTGQYKKMTVSMP